MRKQTELEKYQNRVVQNGVARLSFHATDFHDIVHPFSVKGYELLSDDFVAFLEKYRNVIPARVPVVLEIKGLHPTPQEKELIDDTIWSHLCLNMTSADLKARSCINRSLLFLLYTLLSAILLFAVQGMSGEVLTSIAYLPFWFFGYRLLIYLLIDALPLWKQKQWYRQLAAMEVVFCEDNASPSKPLSADEMKAKISEYLHVTDEQLAKNRMSLQYARNRGITELGCTAASPEDLILTPRLSDEENMSAALSAYLGQAEPFLSRKNRITFEIRGKAFTPQEQQRILQAIRNNYSFRITEQDRGILDNRHKILIFTLLFFVSIGLLLCWGAKTDVATHEFISMLFWFFADYLLDFILIGHFDFKKNRRILENCRDMEVRFTPEKQ